MARNARKGFTIVELMIAIVIFSVGIMGVYALVQSSINASGRARDEAVAANLVREQLELAHWLRDANWSSEKAWSGTEAPGVDAGSATSFGSGAWTVENIFETGKSIKLTALPADFSGEVSAVVADRTYTALSLDAQGRYVHGAGTPTPWHSYLVAEEVSFPENTPREALRITSVVVRDGKVPKEWRAATLLTNWKR